MGWEKAGFDVCTILAVSLSRLTCHGMQIKDKAARKINFEQFKAGLQLIVRSPWVFLSSA